MELYYIIAVTDADRGEVMNALFREAGLPMILSMPGRGTAKNEHLAVYGLGQTPKTVTCAVAGAQQAVQLTRAAKRKLFIDIPGNGILLTVPLKSVAGGRTLTPRPVPRLKISQPVCCSARGSRVIRGSMRRAALPPWAPAAGG